MGHRELESGSFERDAGSLRFARYAYRVGTVHAAAAAAAAQREWFVGSFVQCDFVTKSSKSPDKFVALAIRALVNKL